MRFASVVALLVLAVLAGTMSPADAGPLCIPPMNPC